jgi:hypothetical protein
MPFRAASADGHNANLKFGSYERMQPELLAIFIAAMCADLHGSSIKLIEPKWKILAWKIDVFKIRN